MFKRRGSAPVSTGEVGATSVWTAASSVRRTSTRGGVLRALRVGARVVASVVARVEEAMELELVGQIERPDNIDAAMNSAERSDG